MASNALDGIELFDPEFLESLSRLRLLARRVASGGRPAEQRSRDLGSGLEFRDFRPYSPGDDFRAIDWNIYQRLGKVFLRLFEELEDLPVYLLPDVSDSVFSESPPRAIAGLRCTLALASIGLNHHDSVGLFPFASDLTMELRRAAGKGRLLRFIERLSAQAPKGTTDFQKSIQRFNAFGFRKGLCVVISDFFDPGGLDAVVSALRQVRHRLVLVQLVRKTDEHPELMGDLQLVDSESGMVEDVSVTPAVIARYREAYRRFHDGLADFAKSRNAGILRLDCDAPVVPQLATLFETGSLVV